MDSSAGLGRAEEGVPELGVAGVSSSAKEKRGLENHRYQTNIAIVITDSSSNPLEMAPSNQSHFEIPIPC